MYRGTIFINRLGAAIQAISAIDIPLLDICGKAHNQPRAHTVANKKMGKYQGTCSNRTGAVTS